MLCDDIIDRTHNKLVVNAYLSIKYIQLITTWMLLCSQQCRVRFRDDLPHFLFEPLQLTSTCYNGWRTAGMMVHCVLIHR